MSGLRDDIAYLSAAAHNYPRGFHGHTYRITPTGPDTAPALGEVTLTLDGTGGFRYIDYFTVEQAEFLAGVLRTAARAARSRADEARASCPEAA